MIKFTKAVEKLEDGYLLKESGKNTWIIMREFVWLLDYDKPNGAKIIIPCGFRTDFGSIPQCLWWFFNPTKYVAYILHDFLYSKPEPYSRRECDIILISALKVEGMWLIKRIFVYIGVRLFGWLFFQNRLGKFTKKVKNIFSKK